MRLFKRYQPKHLKRGEYRHYQFDRNKRGPMNYDEFCAIARDKLPGLYEQMSGPNTLLERLTKGPRPD